MNNDNATTRRSEPQNVLQQPVAAGVGYLTVVTDFDRDGVDVQIRAAGAVRPSLDMQLKATINLGEEATPEPEPQR